MFETQRKRNLEKRRALFERRTERTRIHLDKRRNSPRHRDNTRRILDRWRQVHNRGARYYFLTRWPIYFVSISALFLGTVYMMDGSFNKLTQPRVEVIELVLLVIGAFSVTWIGWRLVKPLQN